MDCERIQDRLSAYLDGELIPEEKADIDVHLRACPECAEILALLQTATESLASFPEIEPSGELKAKLYAIPARKKKFRLSLDFLARPALQPILTAATAFLILFSFYMFGPYKRDIDKTVNRQIHAGYSQLEKLYAKAGSLTDSVGSYAGAAIDSLKKINPLGKKEE